MLHQKALESMWSSTTAPGSHEMVIGPAYEKEPGASLLLTVNVVFPLDRAKNRGNSTSHTSFFYSKVPLTVRWQIQRSTRSTFITFYNASATFTGSSHISNQLNTSTVKARQESSRRARSGHL